MGKTYWNRKVVVVTGGSAGLGRELTKHFCSAGAEVVIWARDTHRAETAAREIQSEINVRASCVAVDVTDESQVQAARESVISRFGRLDGLVNCVGASSRYKLEQLSAGEFRQAMDINFFSTVNCVQACLADLCRSRGQIINIASLAGLTAWPFLAPYVASKSALAAYSAQLRLELAGQVQVLTVFPGPIRRPDMGSRYLNSTDSVPEAAMSPGAGAPVSGLDPDKLCRSILKAAERGKRQLVLPWKAKLLFQIQALCPGLGELLLQRLASKVRA